MIVGNSIFQEFNLPNSTTWFYFSLLLAIALFFRFTRLLSVRNVDVIALFLLVPGLLLLLEAQARARTAHAVLPQGVANLLMESASVRMTSNTGFGGALVLGSAMARVSDSSSTLAWYGYLWLLCGSAFFFLRCLLDLRAGRQAGVGPQSQSFGSDLVEPGAVRLPGGGCLRETGRPAWFGWQAQCSGQRDAKAPIISSRKSSSLPRTS